MEAKVIMNDIPVIGIVSMELQAPAPPFEEYAPVETVACDDCFIRIFLILKNIKSTCDIVLVGWKSHARLIDGVPDTERSLIKRFLIGGSGSATRSLIYKLCILGCSIIRFAFFIRFLDCSFTNIPKFYIFTIINPWFCYHKPWFRSRS